MHNRSHRGIGFAAGDTRHTQEAGFSLDQSDDADKTLADDRVAFPLAYALAGPHHRRALSDAPPTEALAFAWSATAVSPSFASSQSRPQRAAALAVGGDVLIDALVADCHAALIGDLLRTPAIGDARFHRRPDRLTDTRLRACRVSTLRALSMRRAAAYPFDACGARHLAADRAGISLQLLADLVSGGITAMRRLNLLAFVLARCV